MVLSSPLESLVKYFAPHNCVGCGREGSLLCNWCQADLEQEPLPERCYKCLAHSAGNAVCAKCRKTTKLKHVWITAVYGGVAKKLVYQLKFSRASAAAKPIAAVMGSVLPYFDKNTIVTYLPTASSRVRRRGYDQANLISQELAIVSGLKQMKLLARLGQKRQVGAGRAQRQSQLTHAFRPLKTESIKGAHILLVDDIITTGASLEAAATVLKAAGAKTVDAAIFARKQN